MLNSRWSLRTLVLCVALILLSVGSSGCGDDSKQSDADTSGDTSADTADQTTDSTPDTMRPDMITPNTGRVSAGQILLYLFNESAGRVVYDQSQNGIPVDAYMRIPSQSERLVGRNGVTLTYSSYEDNGLISMGPATLLTEQLMATGAFTFEVWITPAADDRTGPARIFQIAKDSSFRNVMLGASDTRFAVRLRTTDEDNEDGGTPTLTSPEGVIVPGETAHFAVTFENEVLKAYKNGVELEMYSRNSSGELDPSDQPDPRPGTLANWDTSQTLMIGNENSGGRCWDGEIYLAAIYDRALTPAQIQQNIDAGYTFGIQDVVVDENPPDVAPQLSAEVIPGMGVALDWSWASDPEQLSHFVVYRNGEPRDITFGYSHMDTSFEDGSRMTYQIGAVDRGGNETRGNSIVIQMPGTSPQDHLHTAGNRRHWEDHGEAFVMVADRADLMVEKLNPTDLFLYLDTRQAQGFNTIIFNVLPSSSTGIGADGSAPFNPDDTFNEFYWNTMDVIVDEMRRRDLNPAFIVAPGDWLGAVPDLNAYGEMLGSRYHPTFYFLGNGTSPSASDINSLNLLAGGVRTRDSDSLMGVIPPRDGNLINFFDAESWYNINVFRSATEADGAVWNAVEQSFADEDPFARPSIDFDMFVEDAPSRYWESTTNPRLDAYDLRRSAWRFFFAGGAGFVYQAQGVAEFRSSMDPSPNGERLDWKDALYLEGVDQLQYLTRFARSRTSYYYKEPRQTLIFGDPGTGASAMRATLDPGDWAAVYMPVGREVSVNLDLLDIGSETVKVWWYSPRTGAYYFVEETDSTGAKNYTPPTTGAGNDWLLVMDKATNQYPPPGVSLGDLP